MGDIRAQHQITITIEQAQEVITKHIDTVSVVSSIEELKEQTLRCVPVIPSSGVSSDNVYLISPLSG